MPTFFVASLMLASLTTLSFGQAPPPREQGQIPTLPAPTPIPTQNPAPIQIQTQPQAPTIVPPNFSVAQNVVEPDRLAISPVINGQFDDEDWDPLTRSEDQRTFFEWAPGTIYAAAIGPVGSDLLVSLDLGNNGWLVGKDNIEARVTLVNGKPTVTVNLLDATNRMGPVWKELQGMEISSITASNGDATRVSYQLRLSDPGLGLLPRFKSKIGVRVELVPSTQPQSPANQPRVLTPVNLVEARAAVLPSGLKWYVARNDKPFPVGEDAEIRFTFQGDNSAKLTKVEMRPEGKLRDSMSQITVPFPNLDGNKKQNVDYKSKIDPRVQTGYHVLKATLLSADGTPATIEASFFVSPAVDVMIGRPTIPASPHDRSVPINIFVVDYSKHPVVGTISVEVTSPNLKSLNGSGSQHFAITEPRGRAEKKLELFVPAGTVGSFPVECTVDIHGKKFTKTCYFSIVGN